MSAPVIQTLSELVRINSVNPEWDGPGEAAVGEYVQRFFEGAAVEVWSREVLPGRANIYVLRRGKTSERCLLLEAHMDTVGISGMQIAAFEPELKNGHLYGRGSCDVKAGLAAMMHAVRDFTEEPDCDVLLATVVDEEHRYRGVLGLIEDLQKRGITPSAAIVAEPTELRVVRANKGVLRFRILAEGRAAHSARPHLGVSAIEGMARVVLSIREDAARLAQSVHPLLGPATCSIGTIQGGTQVNLVPETCVIEVDRRLLPGERVEEVMADYERLVHAVRRTEPGLQLRLEHPSLADEAMETSAEEPIVRQFSEILAEAGLEPAPIGVPFGCDCTKLSRAGIPSVIFGPGSIDRAHTADEYVEVDQVEKAVEVLKKILTFSPPLPSVPGQIL